MLGGIARRILRDMPDMVALEGKDYVRASREQRAWPATMAGR
jgi:hypothetical protein